MNRVHCLFLALSVAMLWGTSPLGAAVLFLEDFEGPANPDPPNDLDELGWLGQAGSVAYGAGANLPTTVAMVPSSGVITTKPIGAALPNDQILFTVDMFLAGVYDAAGGEGMVGLDDGSGNYLNALLVGPNANPANPGYPFNAGGWVLWDGLDVSAATRVNITDGGSPGVGSQFKGTGSTGAVQVQMAIDPSAGSFGEVSIDIYDLIGGASLNPTWTMPLSANDQANLTNLDSVMMTWQDVHPGDLKEVDNIRIDTGTTPATQWEWVANGLGDWNSPVSWGALNGVGPQPNSTEHTAIFGGSISSPTLAGVNSPVTANRIEFDSAQPYVIGGASNVSLAASISPADPTVEVISGDHEFQVDVSLAANTDVNVAGGASLTFENRVDLNGNTLDIQSGRVNLNNTLDTGGTGLVTNGGTLAGGGTVNGSLTNGATATIAAEILGTGTFDVNGLTITGIATLDGLLDVTGGFSPSLGNMFTVLTAGSIVDSGLELTPAADAIYDMTIGATTIVLTATSSAGTGADFDGNDLVDGSDFLIWQRNFPIASGALQTQGDADGNGTVDGLDLAAWESTYGSPPVSSGVTAVPEPSTLVLTTLLGVIAIALYRRHQLTVATGDSERLLNEQTCG